MRARLLALLAPALLVCACGGAATTTPASASVAAPVATAATSTSAPASSAQASGTGAASQAAGGSPAPVAFAHGILGAQTATATAPDGSAANPRSRFEAASDRRIVVVLALDQGVPAGTRLAFLRTLNGAYVDSREATIARVSRYFYFDFTAVAGKSFTVGHYRLRLYVNGADSGEVDYQVV